MQQDIVCLNRLKVFLKVYSERLEETNPQQFRATLVKRNALLANIGIRFSKLYALLDDQVSVPSVLVARQHKQSQLFSVSIGEFIDDTFVKVQAETVADSAQVPDDQ